MNCKGVFSKQSDLWKTPSNIYKHFMEDGYFDPCPANPTFDGLSIQWKKKNFVNPPYSQIMKWLDKAFAERERENYSVFLLPARTDTKWFAKIVRENCKIVFIQGRLKFNDYGTAPFPSMYVVIDEKRQFEVCYEFKEKKMTTYYETFLREIFYNSPENADIVLDVYEKDIRQRDYIINVIEDYIRGGSRFQAVKRLLTWIIEPELKSTRKVVKKSEYLDREFEEKMR